MYGGDTTLPGLAPDEDHRKKQSVLQYIFGLCGLAAEECYENMTRLLIETLELYETHIEEHFIIKNVARAGLLDLVKRVLEEKAYAEDEVYVAFRSAATGGHLAVVEYLLEAAHAKEVQIAPAIDSALALAAGRSYLAVFERLLQAWAKSNKRGLTGERSYIHITTSLEAAARGGNLAIFGRLLQAKSHESQEWSPDELNVALEEAARAGHCSIVELLIQAGADVNVKNGYPLMRAATGGHLSTVERLIQAGADVNVNGYYGNSLLAEVATGDHLLVVKRLVQAGADINSSSSFYQLYNRPTPLIAASIAGHFSVVAWLLEAGADPKSTYTARPVHRNKPVSTTSDLSFTPKHRIKLNARTAREHALRNGHYAVAERLHKVSEANNDNQYPSRMEPTHDTSPYEESSS